MGRKRRKVLVRPSYVWDGAKPVLFGEYDIGTPAGAVACRPVFALCAEV
jgi:hypothetical protein